jgi:endonuclease G, mitochondrial
MRYRNVRRSFALSALILSAALAGCMQDAGSDPGPVDPGQDPGVDPATNPDPNAALTTSETFEAGSKTAYAAGNVTLSSGVWALNDALIGTTTSDVKAGAKAGRIRNSGTIEMTFDRSTGAGTVTVSHAAFGTDSNGSWGLFSSTNQGATWTQEGAAVTTAGHTLATASFAVNRTGAVRLQIRKLDGGANRINIDDISIGDPGGGGGGGTGGGTISRHTALGLPAPASTTDLDAYLSVKSGYVISYNSSLKVPNWVSWELNTSYLGSTPRQDTFRPDDTLPANVPQAALADYSGSGYDRGHMTPSADRTLTVAANSQTFYLTNMIPQAGNNNRGPWARLEDYCRTLVASGKEVFITSGGTFSASSNWIGSGVMVPDSTFKVIVVLDSTTQGPANVTSATRVIGILMPNEDSQITLGADWHNYRVSVDSIEALTGYNFLSDVSTAVQAVVEARVDAVP